MMCLNQFLVIRPGERVPEQCFTSQKEAIDEVDRLCKVYPNKVFMLVEIKNKYIGIVHVEQEKE